jgi:hypothetical protein
MVVIKYRIPCRKEVYVFFRRGVFAITESRGVLRFLQTLTESKVTCAGLYVSLGKGKTQRRRLSVSVSVGNRISLKEVIVMHAFGNY